ncbi:response regulator receiver protein [Candidatus Magnetobacterium bavaricum]|uniref:Response regulator receiver protein n=1 Tax=Candidatus Magnetobacterium bavaricum TaxID=29290 RepID=A0A0F3GIU0_9BACT|nr:response regulator receiver protein [Candidatus Magnetobacterium bavaricum]
MQYNDLLKITRELTALYVEDDRPVQMINRLEKIFKTVILAEDGNEGYEKYRQNNVDLVLTDYLMPEVNGLQLIKNIRAQDRKTPIILITGFIDSEFLIDAINQGVTQFVTKPIIVAHLLNAIEIAVSQVVMENLAQKTQQQELELLRYREKYHFTQQEMAFLKELRIIKNDFNLKRIDTINDDDNACSLWYIDIHYMPLDILSGDSYSVRELGTGEVIVFIIDAMGKGLSASVTSILTTSFVNHLIDGAIEKGGFDFSEFLRLYTDFIAKELLSEEIVCASFIYIDFNQHKMHTSMYSMPPVLVMKQDGQLLQIKSNNLPIMKYSMSRVIDTHDMTDFTKILICSDGLSESWCDNDPILYHEYLLRDFMVADFKDDLYKCFNKHVKTPGDDVTFIFLNKFDYKDCSSDTIVINSTLDDVQDATCKVERYLQQLHVNEGCSALFISALSEIIMNAYEHGSLDLDLQLKQELTSQGTYESYLMEKQKNTDKKIMVDLNIIHGRSGLHPQTPEPADFLMATVTDEGKGFDVSNLSTLNVDNHLLCGRGIKVAKNTSDVLLYNRAGNQAVLIKTLIKD